MRNVSKIALATLLASTFAFGAGSTSSDTTLTVNAQPGCSVQNSPALNISYTGLADATGSFDLQLLCDTGVAYTVAVGDGLNVDTTAGVRRASDGAGNFIVYRLYSDASLTTELGVSGVNNTIAGTGDATTQTITIYASVKTADNATAVQGTYTDTLQISITW